MPIDAFSTTDHIQQSPFLAHRTLVAATRHAASAGHYLAAHAAFRILEAGGNAVDAGVAAGLVMGVVQSDQVSVAGVAPMMIYLAQERRLITIDGLGTWPAAATCEFFASNYGGVVPEGVLRTVVPAAPAAWLQALRDYGTMRFGEVASAAIRFARDGFIMYPFLAFWIEQSREKYRRWASSAEIYLPNGQLPKVGDLFVQSDLARSLQYMADQEQARGGSREDGLAAAHDAFYRGDIAQAILKFHRQEGGLLSAADLAGYRPQVGKPLSTRFGDMDVYSCGYWCQGPALLQSLEILKHVDLGAMAHNSVEYVHHVAEALKLTFSDREHYYGDPDFVAVPQTQLLDPAYGLQRRKLIDARRAYPGMPSPGRIDGFPLDFVSPAVSRGDPPPPSDTSYVCVVDSKGNAFSATPSDPSNDTPVVPGTGLCPSSRGSQSRGIASHPSSVAPGKRPRLTPTPAIAMREGRMVMPFGTPGGDAQVQSMLQYLLNVSVYGMDPQQAIEAPRFITYSHPDSFSPHGYYPARLCLEGRYPRETGAALAALGHDVQWWPDWMWKAGGVCAIQSDMQTGVHRAGADPRRAAAYAVGW
ncbi:MULTISPECIES: gamma-glutamyltransferase family protein [unclassified Achromobacter]|uniref:gamma-glutamyltransferase family protein n=1 Tax=unclassified Achromobacter TaxID=2626865 RepID=UPI000B515445|nr:MULTISPECIES: gamma-glutamyltransferase family protein [unclassified Achromobacter]OWT80760.1 gamma-glutamyltransferase [Achromobacter sp. HZ34]OWT81276.1 gamma-glutamyltransferase [Achromobacter sp. HZ28]